MNPHNMQLIGTAVYQARQRLGLSLAELSLAMGWQGTSPLIAIEKGRRLPQPDTLERLGRCLQLPHTDIVYLQGLAGYRQPTQLPAFERIRMVLKEIIAAHPPEQLIFPAYVIDYQFRIWMANAALLLYVDHAADLIRTIVDRRRTILEIIFDSQLNIGQASANQPEINRDQIYRFKSRNLFRRHEEFYLAYPACMAALLSPADFAAFKAAWDAVQTDAPGHYRLKTLNKSLYDGIQMNFILEDAPIPQLDDLFFMVTYYPEPTPENLQACQAVFGSLPPVETRWFIPEEIEALG